MRDILVFVGAAASGKDYISNKWVEFSNSKKAVSMTTRSPRDGEKDGVDYWFISEEQFFKYKEERAFIETTEYKTTDGTWYYGFHKNSVSGDDIKCMILNPEGIDQLIFSGYKNRMAIVYVMATTENRIERYADRMGENPSEKKLAEAFLRLLRDAKDFERFENDLVLDNSIYSDFYYHGSVPTVKIRNNDFDSDVKTLLYDIEDFLGGLDE